jgi:putative addiction module antidote
MTNVITIGDAEPSGSQPTTKEPTMTALKLTQIGNSVGVVLPKDVLSRLKVVKGDTLFVTEAANGVMLTPYDPTLEEQLELGRDFMREYRDTFHQLAK